MPFPILFGTTVTTVLHYRADCDNEFAMLETRTSLSIDYILVRVD